MKFLRSSAYSVEHRAANFMTEKTHVLFIQSQNAFGADSLIQAEIARYLDRNKFVVHVACTKGDGQGTPDSLAALQKIPDIQLRSTSFAPGLRRRGFRQTVQGVGATLTFPAEFWKLRDYVRDHRIRILHGTEKPRDAMYAFLLGRLTGAKSVTHIHVKWSEEYTFPAKFSVRHADAALAISHYVRDTIVGMGKPPAQVYTVLNALDASGWDPDQDGTAVRDELNIPRDALVLASISRLFSWKGVTELIKALALVKPHFPHVKLLVVGADELYVHGGSYTAELKRLVETTQLTDNVIFTGFRRDVGRVMAACDIFTMPSFEEPFGVVFLEAMAMRKPVIGIDNGGTPEVVTQGKAGLLSPPWDIPKLAENILTLLRDASLRRQMGEFGRERTLTFFNPQRMADEVGDVYEQLLRD